MTTSRRFLSALCPLLLSIPSQGAETPAITDGASIQAAIDANPGKLIYVPAGDYEIHAALKVTGTGGGLYGPGHIVQTNTDAEIVAITGASDIQLKDLRLSRPEGKTDTLKDGILIKDCQNVVLSNIQVVDNRSDHASIFVMKCDGFQLRDSLVQNYSRISVDDRTKGDLYGYAFNCINGTGLIVKYSKGIAVTGNRVIESVMLPTAELKAKYKLGSFVKKNETMGRAMNKQAWDANYVNNWHQGSAIQVTSPEVTDYVQLLNNYVENAAQGIDIHADHVIMANNIVNNSFMGMKAMHGARNVILLANQFSKNDLWSIGMMPGTASHGPDVKDGQPRGYNGDGHSIIAKNIVSDFGYGNSHWSWGSDGTPFKFDSSPLPENPTLTDVIIDSNILYDTGRDQILVDGKPRVEAPRYSYAAGIAGGDLGPVGLRFSNNILAPGARGVSTKPISPEPAAPAAR